MNSTVTEVFHAAAASSLSWAVNTMWTLCTWTTILAMGSYAGDAPSPGPISNMKSWLEPNEKGWLLGFPLLRGAYCY